MASLDEILNKRLEDIEPPKALPPGTYLGIVEGDAERIESRDKHTPGFRFQLRLIRDLDVADQAALAAAGGCAGQTRRYDMYVTEKSQWFLSQFLQEHLGIDKKLTILEALSHVAGKEVGVVIRNTLSSGTSPRLIDIVAGTIKAA